MSAPPVLGWLPNGFEPLHRMGVGQPWARRFFDRPDQTGFWSKNLFFGPSRTRTDQRDLGGGIRRASFAAASTTWANIVPFFVSALQSIYGHPGISFRSRGPVARCVDSSTRIIPGLWPGGRSDVNGWHRSPNYVAHRGAFTFDIRVCMMSTQRPPARGRWSNARRFHVARAVTIAAVD
jgi:hypothetical protein